MEERDTELQEVSTKFEPDRGDDPAHEGDEDEDDESILDISSDEELHKLKTKLKKPSHSRQLHVDIQSAQGKNVSEDGKNTKCKANEIQEDL